MKLDRYLEICKEIEAEERATEEKKRASYTAGNENVLHNFLDDSEFVGTDPLQNVLTHLMKQIRAVSSYVKHPDVQPSETLLSRVVDIRVYSKLLVAVAQEMGRESTGVITWYKDPINEKLTNNTDIKITAEDRVDYYNKKHGRAKWSADLHDETGFVTYQSTSSDMSRSSWLKLSTDRFDYTFGSAPPDQE